jgi:hypothetical protein
LGKERVYREEVAGDQEVLWAETEFPHIWARYVLRLSSDEGAAYLASESCGNVHVTRQIVCDMAGLGIVTVRLAFWISDSEARRLVLSFREKGIVSLAC